MRRDQARILSTVIVMGLLYVWWGVFQTIDTARFLTFSDEASIMKGRAIPTMDATQITMGLLNRRLFLELWMGLVVVAAASAILLAWIGRAWSLMALSVAALLASAGFLTFHWSTVQISQAFAPDLVAANFISDLRGSLDRRFAAERFEWGWDAVPWLVDVVFVRVPLWVALVIFPLVSLFEIVRHWRLGRKVKEQPFAGMEPFQGS